MRGTLWAGAPPSGSFAVNRASWQAKGLLFWAPPAATPGGSLVDLARERPATQFVGPTWSAHPVLGHALSYATAEQDHVSWATDPRLDTLAQLTLCAWLVNNALQTFRDVLTKSDGSVGWALGLGGATTRCRVHIGGNAADVSNALTLGVVKHVVGVYDGTQTGNANRLKIYVDGVLQSPSYIGTIPATSGDSSAWPISIGRESDGFFYWNGLIGDCRIYNRPLSAAEVWQLYAPETRWELYQPARWRSPAQVTKHGGTLGLSQTGSDLALTYT